MRAVTTIIAFTPILLFNFYGNNSPTSSTTKLINIPANTVLEILIVGMCKEKK